MRKRTRWMVVYKKKGKKKDALRHPVGKSEAMTCAKILRSLKHPIKARIEKVR